MENLFEYYSSHSNIEKYHGEKSILSSVFFSDFIPQEVLNSDRTILLVFYGYSILNKFSIDGLKNEAGIPTIMIHVQKLEDTSDYDIYRYNGILQIDRTKDRNMVLDNIVNMDELVKHINDFLQNN